MDNQLFLLEELRRLQQQQQLLRLGSLAAPSPAPVAAPKYPLSSAVWNSLSLGDAASDFTNNTLLRGLLLNNSANGVSQVRAQNRDIAAVLATLAAPGTATGRTSLSLGTSPNNNDLLLSAAEARATLGNDTIGIQGNGPHAVDSPAITTESPLDAIALATLAARMDRKRSAVTTSGRGDAEQGLTAKRQCVQAPHEGNAPTLLDTKPRGDAGTNKQTKLKQTQHSARPGPKSRFCLPPMEGKGALVHPNLISIGNLGTISKVGRYGKKSSYESFMQER